MTVPATYRDGAFHPDAPVALPDGTRVEISVETPAADPYAWMDILAEANLDGPADASENVNEYVSGRKVYTRRRAGGKDVE